MADFRLFFDRLMEEEGGYTDHPADKGGPTKYGITLAEWIKKGYDKDHDGDIDKDDVKLIDKTDAYKICKADYWDPLRADEIANQSVADFIFDWGFNSGIKTAAKYVQRTLGFSNGNVDGVIGDHTIAAINAADPHQLFDSLKLNRERFYRAIVSGNPSQAVFLKGWLNRNNSFTYTS